MLDLRFALRLLAKSPGFAAAAIGVLALGLGLNTGMFSLVYALVFSPRPFADPASIVQLYTQNRQQPDSYRLFSHPLWRELEQRHDLFAGVMAFNHTLVGHQEGETVRRAFASLVSANYFDVLGVRLVRGRAFTAEEASPGASLPVVIVSYAHWRKTGFDPGLVGRTLRINERAYTVVGIAPEGFSGTTALVGPEFYFPLGVFESLENFALGEERRALARPDAYQLFLVARLAPGVELGSARSALAALGTNLERAFPVEFKEQTITAGPLPRLGTSSSPRSEGPVAAFGAVLLALSASVLLIVCLNLAGLMVARGQARRREFAIRLALGGSRARLVRQLCLEGLLLALAGGALGLFAADAVLGFIIGTIESRLPLTLFPVAAGSSVVVAATVVICVGATLAFSLFPALQLSRSDVLTNLKQAKGDDSAGVRSTWWRPRHPLVVAQIALSLGLLVVAGVFLRMSHGALSQDRGFRADDTVVAEVDTTLGGFDETRSRAVLLAARERLAALPGVQSAAVAATVPYGFVQSGRSVRRDGPEPAPEAQPATAAEGRAFAGSWNAVSADYFTVMGLPLRDGRTFTPAESAAVDGPRVVILDEVLARQLWPEGGAVGQFVRFAGGRDAAKGPLQVVGVVRSAKIDFFDEAPEGAVYVPFAQGASGNAFFHVRPVQAQPAAATALVPTVRTTLAAAASGVPVFKVTTFRQHAESSMEVWAAVTGSMLLTVFSGFTMIVAVAGIYSVKAYQVSRRTREIGIRMALGARPSAVEGLILREGLATAALGIALGLFLGVGLNHLLSSVLYGVRGFDAGVLLGTAFLFFVAAFVAAWLPARRATRVDPMVALRAE